MFCAESKGQDKFVFLSSISILIVSLMQLFISLLPVKHLAEGFVR